MLALAGLRRAPVPDLRDPGAPANQRQMNAGAGGGC